MLRRIQEAAALNWANDISNWSYNLPLRGWIPFHLTFLFSKYLKRSLYATYLPFLVHVPLLDMDYSLKVKGAHVLPRTREEHAPHVRGIENPIHEVCRPHGSCSQKLQTKPSYHAQCVIYIKDLYGETGWLDFSSAILFSCSPENVYFDL